MKWLTSAIKLPCVKVLTVLMAATLITGNSYAQQFSFDGKRKKEVINFLLIKNLIIVPLYLNDKGPFNFILDTGVGPLIISDPAMADSLKIKNLRPIKIAGLGKGNEIDAFVSSDIKAQLGSAIMDNIPSAILKTDLFRLSNYVGMPIHGLLGYHFFKSFVVEVRYSSKRLRFYTPGWTTKIKGEKIPLDIINDKPYAMVAVESEELGLIGLKLLVDNGASHAVSLEMLHEKPFPLPVTSIPANLGMGLGGPISGNIGRMKSLKIGNYTLKAVLSSFPKYEEVAGKVLMKDRNGNLGADILSKFDITFDYNNNLMYIRKNSNFSLPFEHDMAGMEIYADGDKIERYFINRIEPGSPSENSGLLPGDEIIYINFAPAGNFSLTEINRLMKSGDGKRVALTIVRDGELHIKLIKLKQRI